VAFHYPSPPYLRDLGLRQ